MLYDCVNRRRTVVTNVSITFDYNRTKINVCALRKKVTDFGATWTTNTFKILKLKTICSANDNLWAMMSSNLYTISWHITSNLYTISWHITSNLYTISWHITSNLKTVCGVRYFWVSAIGNLGALIPCPHLTIQIHSAPSLICGISNVPECHTVEL
jgi:hypothetical protein